MNYSEGIKHMMDLSNQTGTFSPYPGIIINYPGKKDNGDYRLTVQEGQAPTHPAICRQLYDFIENGHYTFHDLSNFLTDVYSNGTNTEYANPTLEYLQYLIYWVTLQEEINYPRARRGCAGINLPFCRYLEAIYCTQPENNFDIQTVQIRCNNHGRNKPDLYPINNAPYFYNY